MISRSRIAAASILFVTLALAACSPQAVSPTTSAATQPAAPATQPAIPATQPAGQATQPVAQATNAPATQASGGGAQPTQTAAASGDTTGGGEVGGGVPGVEGTLVTFSDASRGFAIGHPGTWTQDPAVTKGVKFAGGDSSMLLEFVTPPAGQDAMTYAKNDVAAVTAAFPGFRQLSLAPSTEVQNAIILGYEANGTSAVTGKAFTAHDERYYMPLADGRIAILTVAGPTNQYDQQGVRDIALTFKTTK